MNRNSNGLKIIINIFITIKLFFSPRYFWMVYLYYSSLALYIEAWKFDFGLGTIFFNKNSLYNYFFGKYDANISEIFLSLVSLSSLFFLFYMSIICLQKKSYKIFFLSLIHLLCAALNFAELKLFGLILFCIYR